MSRPAAKRRTRLDPEQRRKLILDHTAEIISAEGVAALSMERIGRDAGISKSLVYNYFPNLNMLLRELLERELRRLRRMQGEAAEGATARLCRSTSEQNFSAPCWTSTDGPCWW